VPPFALSFALLGTRRTFSRHLGSDDLPAPLEDQARQVIPQLTELILDHRDGLLVDCLASIHQARQNENINVAVVYGAGHMPAITHELLRRYSYRPRTAEWMTVFDF
jgi:pheromone shutdown protein TraB